MNEDSTNKPPIGRYIILALVFVLIFIGASYLVYRFTRGSGETAIMPSPSATSSSSSSSTSLSQTSTPSSSGLRYGTVLPAPTLAPSYPNNRLFIQPTTASQPIAYSNISGYRSIAQDGRGNLLFDNLTHDENFALQRARIDADSRLRLAQENNGHTLAFQKVTTTNDLDRLREQNSAARAQQLDSQASKLALTQEQTKIELTQAHSALTTQFLQLAYNHK